MNGVRLFSTVFLLVLLCATNVALAEEQKVQKEYRVETRDLEAELEFPEFHMLPKLESIDEMEMLAFADEAMPDPKPDRRQHAERIQLFRLWKIMEEVDLSDDQVDKFFPLMREYGRQERELADQRGKLLKALRNELREEKPSDARLSETLAQLKENNRKVVESKNQAINDAAKILSVTQQAKLALSLHEVERNIWESIARVRHLPYGDLRNFEFDKEKLHLNMQQLKENLDRIKQEFEAQGLPAPDISQEDALKMFIKEKEEKDAKKDK